MAGQRQYDRVAVRAGHRCEYCKAPEWIVNHRFELDHVIPRRFGGPATFGNLALACRACNQYKSDQLGLLDPDLGYPIWLFHPRVDGWDAHFVLDLATAVIGGKTEKGTITIEILQMNSLRALIAPALDPLRSSPVTSETRAPIRDSAADEGRPPLVVCIHSVEGERDYLFPPVGLEPAAARQMVGEVAVTVPGRFDARHRRDYLVAALRERGFRLRGAITTRIKWEHGQARMTGLNEPEEPPGLFVVRLPARRVYLAPPPSLAWRKVLAAFRAAVAQYEEELNQTYLQRSLGSTEPGIHADEYTRIQVDATARIRSLFTSAGFCPMAAILVECTPLEVGFDRGIA